MTTFARRPNFGLLCCYLGTMGLDPPAARPEMPELPAGVAVGPFRAPDLQILGPGAMDPTMTEQRLACGDRPWGMWRGRDLLCYGWTSTRPTSILTLSVLIPGPDEAYLYGFYTPPKHRGNGYYPLLLRSICAQLAEEGTRRAWIAVFASNHASWKGVLKAGFQKAATHLSLHGRLSWTVAEGEVPQPTLRPRRRGLHLDLRATSAPKPRAETERR